MEAELAKFFATDKACQVADELVQIGGGRGYETAESAAARGERGVPAEQLLRDPRIGRIFDDSSEVLRVFLGHEAASALHTDGVTSDEPRTHDGPATSTSLSWNPRPGAWPSTWRARPSTDLDASQRYLGRIVDIASELYAMTAAHVYASRCAGPQAVELVDTFCHQARHLIDTLFTDLDTNPDAYDRALAGSTPGSRPVSSPPRSTARGSPSTH